MVWVNGRLANEREPVLLASDHGFVVGDGVFETAKVVRGVPFAFTRHLRRLRASAVGLGLPEPDLELVRRASAEVIDTAGAGGSEQTWVLRITYSSGPGPLGSARGDAAPTLVLAVAPALPWPASTKIELVPFTRNEHGAVAGLKTVSYAENVVALARARRAGAGEALFANTRGHLCEGTGSNVFVVLDGVAYTPPLSSGCLAGVTRALVLEWCGARERELPVSAISAAEEVFITSSTRDVLAVHAVGDRALPAPGPVTAAAAAEFSRRAADDLDP